MQSAFHVIPPPKHSKFLAGGALDRATDLLAESAESQSPEKLLANIRWHSGLRVCDCDCGHRRGNTSVYGRCQERVNTACIWTTEDRSHTRDLTARVNLVGHGRVQVGIGREQCVQVGHHTVLPDEAMRPVEAGVQGASHHLALVVDAGGEGRKIPRKRAQVCDGPVLPKRGIKGCAVRARDEANNLALIVNGECFVVGRVPEVGKFVCGTVLPQNGMVVPATGSCPSDNFSQVIDTKGIAV